MKSQFKINLAWDDSSLIIFPAFPALKEFLQYTKKVMEKEKGKTTFRFEKVALFKETISKNGVICLYTYQGLIDRVLGFFEHNNVAYNIINNCRRDIVPDIKSAIGWRFNQKQLFDDAMALNRSGNIEAPTRYGKCLGEDTEVMMADGRAMKVQDIEDGMFVMGPDNQPRLVSGCHQGVSKMYRVTPRRSEKPFTCNAEHLLVVRNTTTGEREIKTAEEVFKRGTTEYAIIHGGPIELPEQVTSIPPRQYVSDRCRRGRFYKHFDKPLDERYVYTSLEKRLEFLSELIKTRGFAYKDRFNYNVNLRFTNNTHPSFVEGVQRILDLSGFRYKASLRTYKCRTTAGNKRDEWRISVSGPLHELKDCKFRFRSSRHRFTRFDIEELPEGKYYGFTVDHEDGLFLLADNIVTHNTYFIMNTLRAFEGKRTVVTAPGVDLLEQTKDDFLEHLPHRDIVMVGGSSRVKYQNDDITLCSMDSLHKMDHENTELLLIDEPHSAVTDSRAPQISNFNNARKIGFGATLSGRFDGSDVLIEGLIGPTLSRRTYREAVAEGAVCQIYVLMLDVPFAAFSCGDRRRAYKSIMWENSQFIEKVRDICDDIIPQEWQTLVFIDNEVQADRMQQFMGEDNVIAMAKRLSKTQRGELLDKMKSADIKRCLASNIYSTGVTFHEVMAVINAVGGGANISCVQKPGRLAEVRPGKKCGILIDFNFVNKNTAAAETGRGSKWTSLVKDSKARRQIYEDKGYEVYDVRDLTHLKETFDTITNK